MRRTALTLCALLGLFSASALRAADYDEAVDGDLSGDGFNPTVIQLDPGSNLITATSSLGDREYYTTNLPPGTELEAIVLVSYVSQDEVAFIGVQSGTQFTEPPTGTDVSQLLGWMHFGPPFVGTDVLDDIGMGNGAMGFTPPLVAGDYTWWSQQTGATLSTYALDFQVVEVQQVPAMSAAGMAVACLALASLMVVVHRRRLAPARRPRD
jgi:hypothetical protein